MQSRRFFMLHNSCNGTRHVGYVAMSLLDVQQGSRRAFVPQMGRWLLPFASSPVRHATP